MNLKWLLFFVFAIFLINFQESVTAFSIPKVSLESIEKWTDVGVKAAEAASKKNEDLSIAIAVFDALGKAIPKVGPLASLIAGIMSLFVHTPSELSIVLDKLDGMNRKLDHLDNRLSEVMIKIETVAIIGGYKTKVDDVRKLMHAYKRFTATPTNITRDDFRRECGSNKMIEFAHWIDNELNSEHELPLRQVMTQDFDLRNFNYWSEQIATMLSNAMFLHTTCVGVSGYDEKSISETLNGKAGSHNGDIHTFEQLLTNVRKGIYKGMKQIKRGFFAHAKVEVDHFARDNVDRWDHAGFVNNLHELLSHKYYWRAWSVTSWKVETVGSDHHSILNNDRNTWYWHHQYKRCLLVGSVLPDYAIVKLDEKLNHCESVHSKGHVSGQLANSLAQYFFPCIDHDLPLGGLAVVQFGNGLRSIGPSGYEKNVKYNNHEVSIVAIPFDTSATINSGEVCSANGFRCDNGDQQHCCGHQKCCSDTA